MRKMMNYDEMLRTIYTATKGLHSIRPASSRQRNSDLLLKEVNEISGFSKDSAALEIFDNDADALEAFVEGIVTIQFAIFNRTLAQMTAESLADGVLTGLGAVLDTNIGELAEMRKVVHLFCVYIEAHHLAKPGLAVEFEQLVTQKRPDVVAFSDSDDGRTVEINGLDAADWLDCDPVKLLPIDQTEMFAHFIEDVDFNTFIALIAKRHSPAQLQLAYGLFLTREPIYSALLEWAEFMDDGRHLYSIEEIDLYVSSLWSFASGLTTDGLIALSKVIHQYLKFCLNQELISDRQYATLLKMSNRGIVKAAVMWPLARQNVTLAVQRGQESVAISDRIFTRVNYTIDTVKAHQELDALHRQPVATAVNPDAKLVLKKSLTDRQETSELKQAQERLTGMEKQFGSSLTVADGMAYRQAILQIHQIMIEKFHRQVKHWTRDSLAAALIALFQDDRNLDTRPVFLRYLQFYLGTLLRANAIGSLDALDEGMMQAVFEYICCSTNALLE